jgi:hypothetical protein
MSRSTPKSRFSRLLALVALASYGSAGILGYGLHEFVGHSHHSALAHSAPTASASNASTPAAHDCGCHGHCHGSDPASLAVTLDCDDCSICSFLAQAQSPDVPKPLLEGSQPLAPRPPTVAPLALLSSVDSPTARGPPVA